MTLPHISRYATLAIVISLSAVGCMKRKETIKIAPDGAVTLRVEYETDSPAEFDAGDAMPSAAAGWKVSRTEETENVTTNGETKTHYKLDAEKTVAPGERLPGTFAVSDVDTKVYLQFPTTLRIERRPDGTYYHFRRTYAPRPEWGLLEARRQEIFDSLGKGLDEKPSEQWTADDRLHMVEASVKFELAKMAQFARVAFNETLPDAPQDQWLKVHATLNGLQNTVDCAHLADLIAGRDDDARTQAIEAEAVKFEAQAMTRLASTLTEGCGYRRPRVNEFMERYQWHKRYHEISEGLGDDNFEITVEMPGEIVGSNADRTEDSKAAWTFDGTALRLQPVELMVTSRVAN